MRRSNLWALVLESDGPWPYRGEFGQRPGEPAMVARAGIVIAELLGRPLDEVVGILAENARRWLGVPA